ncbi:MAG: hypothetical protein UE783_08460 [Prevotella sp.]|nr:hypothetical protein [Prevotella sp.]
MNTNSNNSKSVNDAVNAQRVGNAVNSQRVGNEHNNDAQVRIAHYAARFAEYDDEKLQATVAYERKVRGWVSERSYFLAALREECEKRHLDYCW